MNNNEKNINNWFAKFNHRFDKTVPNIVAETAVEFYQDRFKTQEWDGVPWQPLKPRYAAKKTRGRGSILTASGILMRSIRPSTVSPAKVTISAGNTKVPYAKIHNEGGRVSGAFKVKTFRNTNFMGTGKSVQIKSHIRNVNFTMPKRQFMGHSKFLNTILIDRLTKSFKTN
jgi:phage gpG-like protein